LDQPGIRFVAACVVSLALAGCGAGNGAAPGGGGGAAASGGAGGRGAGGSGTGGAADTGGAGAGGAGTPGTGGVGTGGAADTGGAGVGAGGAGGVGGASGGDAGEADVASDAPAGGFTCTLFVGPSPMMQWFRGGFLKHPGIDAGRYQLIWVAHHYTDAWGAPGDSGWNTALDQGHACAQNAMAPDRVAFMATQWSYTTAAQWEKDLTGIVANIKAKWPAVKRIELMASTSAPGNKPCPAAGGKNNETIIPPFAYEALDAMPAKFPGLVVALPHFEVPACSDFIGNGTAPQYAPNPNATSGPAVMDIVGVFGSYYATHP
jgi:hypothetical protein